MGSKVIDELAKTYSQLYLIPGRDTGAPYDMIIKYGIPASPRDTGLFAGSAEDRIFEEITPAGPVKAVYLADRNDFENFMKIMGERCQDVHIPATTGAAMLSGVRNWNKINGHKEEYLASGGMDWPGEFKEFTKDKNNYTDSLLVISKGPYSHISHKLVNLTEDVWLRCSYKIRVYHECTHFVFRKLYPDKKNAVLDEVIADAAGLVMAFGEFKKEFEYIFLGINPAVISAMNAGNIVSGKNPEIEGEGNRCYVTKAKAGYEENRSDAAETKAAYEKNICDATKVKAGYEENRNDATEAKAGCGENKCDAAEVKAGYEENRNDTTEEEAWQKNSHEAAYTGGRLENYLNDEQKENINEIALRTAEVINYLAGVIEQLSEKFRIKVYHRENRPADICAEGTVKENTTPDIYGLIKYIAEKEYLKMLDMLKL